MVMLLPWDTPALSSWLQLSRGSWRARQYVGSECWLEKKRNMSASSESYQEKKRRSESGWIWNASNILNKCFTAKWFPLSPFLVISWLATFGPESYACLCSVWVLIYRRRCHGPASASVPSVLEHSAAHWKTGGHTRRWRLCWLVSKQSNKSLHIILLIYLKLHML